MLSYEVTVKVRTDLQAAFERYMREKHIPEIWDTLCFTFIQFEQNEEGHFRTCYQTPKRADYDRYIAAHANALRADFMQHFPDGCEVSRQVFESKQEWGINQ